MTSPAPQCLWILGRREKGNIAANIISAVKQTDTETFSHTEHSRAFACTCVWLDNTPALLEFLRSNATPCILQDVVMYCGHYGRRDMLETLIKTPSLKNINYSEAITCATHRGHLDVVTLCINSVDTETICSAFKVACRNGHEEIMRFLYECVPCEKRPCLLQNVYNDCLSVYRASDLRCLQLLHIWGCAKPTRRSYQRLSSNGATQCIKECLKKEPLPTTLLTKLKKHSQIAA